jgi:glycosyltransferase involved in cell wall biosynthesis
MPRKVSVVTSVYNGEKYLAEAIESVLCQTFTDFEFILVDDGSQDRTWGIISKYAQNDARIIPLQNNVNLGVVAGLNRGLDASRGQYIARQDADDISNPERLARQVAFLDKEQDYGAVATTVIYIDTQGKTLDIPSPFIASENEEIQEKLLENNCLCGPTLMIRRTSLEVAGFWFGEGLDASEDYDICLRLGEVSKLASLREPYYGYRQHSQSASIIREYQQVLHKAVALERAIHRRWGEQPPIDKYSVVARDYLWAAVLAYTQQDMIGTRHAMNKSLELFPSMLKAPEILERFLCYRMPSTTVDAVDYVNGFFGEFVPKTPIMNRLHSRLVSSIYMREIFSGSAKMGKKEIRQHIWRGILNDPRWLFNRGVWAITIKEIYTRD